MFPGARVKQIVVLEIAPNCTYKINVAILYIHIYIYICIYKMATFILYVQFGAISKTTICLTLAPGNIC